MEVDISKDILKRLEESFGEKIKSNRIRTDISRNI